MVINYLCDDPVNRNLFESWASTWGARVTASPRAVSSDHECGAQVFDLDHLSPGEAEQILSELFRKPPRPWEPVDILATKTGLVHLPSLVDGREHLLPPTPRYFSPVVLDYGFAIDAPEPTAWLAFLKSLWPDDPDSIGTLQEWLGYNLTPDTSHQKILMLIGPKRSGKGTIARVLTGLIGKANVCGPTLASLATNFGLWPLVGKTAAIISDARLGGRTDGYVVVERLLSISGEDSLTADRKNLEPVTLKLMTRLMLLSNELPRLIDQSGRIPLGQTGLKRDLRASGWCEKQGGQTGHTALQGKTRTLVAAMVGARRRPFDEAKAKGRQRQSPGRGKKKVSSKDDTFSPRKAGDRGLASTEAGKASGSKALQL